ncbi:MAG: MFS transporter [Pseudomonadales bacterium]|jgi:MFS family permease|nr:MFS transporter [Pseudomonadales bacterium]MDP7595584.1 MFS transporter [Pseudomonadales bacterium]HJN52593.1 MFS transporter [Pseudomonadales bacterium]|tara:strand:- start:3886 stop:5166 length:1281 start_codon:yes stop_codon:yes gene_type:complete
MSIPILRPLAIRNFALLWSGSFISMVGDQLTLIAFPWMVLKLTGDPLAMGTVLALAGIPRALFIVFGGAITDRFSARTIMFWSNIGRMMLMVILCYLVFSDSISLWMIYLTALLFGVVDAFFWPASSAIVPQLVDEERLHAANALIQGTAEMSVMAGPFVAGLVIAVFSVEPAGGAVDLTGIAMVFGIDTVTFMVSAITLAMIRLQPVRQDDAPFSIQAMLELVYAGFRAMWQDVPLRILTLVFMIFTLFWRGPYLIGIPVLCDSRFPEGALAYGMIGSAFGVGAFIGTVAGGSLPKPRDEWLGILVLADTLILGTSFLVYAVTPTVVWAALMTTVCGVLDGYLIVILISWIQLRVPTELMGRVMSMIMFFNAGLAPVSAALAGAFIAWSLTGVFVIAGISLVLLSLLGFCFPVTRRMGIEQYAAA